MKQDLILNPDVLAAAKVTTAGEQFYTYGKGDSKFTDYGYIEGLTPERQASNRDFKGNRKGIAKLVKRIETERTESWKFNSASTGSMAVKAAFYGGAAKEGTANGAAFVPSAAVKVDDLITVGDTLLRVTKAGTTANQAPDVSKVTEGGVVTSGDATLVSLGAANQNIVYAFAGGNAIREVSSIAVLSTEESDGASGYTAIIVMPNTQIQGTGNPKIQEFDGYEFTVTLASNTTFAPLTQYGNFAQQTPDSVVLVVPNDRVEEVVNAYGEALKAYRDAL